MTKGYIVHEAVSVTAIQGRVALVVDTTASLEDTERGWDDAIRQCGAMGLAVYSDQPDIGLGRFHVYITEEA